MVSSTGLAGLVLALSQTFLNPAFALPGALPVPVDHEDGGPYVAGVPNPAALPGRFKPRAVSSTHSSSTTVSVTKSSSVKKSSTASVTKKSSTSPVSKKSSTSTVSKKSSTTPVSRSSFLSKSATVSAGKSSTLSKSTVISVAKSSSSTKSAHTSVTKSGSPSKSASKSIIESNSPSNSTAVVVTKSSSPSISRSTSISKSGSLSNSKSVPVTKSGSPSNSKTASATKSGSLSSGQTPPITKSSSLSRTTSGAAVPTVPFGVSTTVVSGTTFSLTYIATTATKPTTIVESNAQTTTTATYSSGAPIWFVPILPLGFPLPPPPPPPIGPPPPPGGGTSGGGGTAGCEFGCEEDNNPSSSQDSHHTTTASPSGSSSTSKSSSTSSASGLFCEVGCSICNLDRREAAPTATPNKPKRQIGNLMQYISSSLRERNIPGEDSDGVSEVYSEVKSSGITHTVELADGPVPGSAVARQGVSSSQFTAFDEAEHNIYIGGLEGCTSVIVVSRQGAWASHFWERPSFTSGDAKFQSDVIGFLHSDLGGHAATFADAATTRIFIMTPAPEANDLNGSGNPSNGNNPQKYGAQVGQITAALNGIVPGATVQTFVYQVQRSEVALRAGAYGKAMILYSNNQNVDPDPQGMFDPWNPAHHAYQVWTQAQLISHDDWIPCTAGQKRDGSSCPISRSSSASRIASSTLSRSTIARSASSKPTSSTAKPISSKPSSSTAHPSSSKPTSSSASHTSSSTPSSTTASPASSSPAAPPVDPNKPTNLKCYGAGTPNSLFSFDAGAATTPINTFCNAWIGDYTYQVDKSSFLTSYPIDGKAWYESSQLLQISGIVVDYNSAKADTGDQKAATIASCVKGLTNILYYCDYGSGTKWGGVGLWNGQVLGIAGDTGTTSLPLGY